MEVRIERNPLIERIWNEWCEMDKNLAQMTEKERLDCCKAYQWVFPKETRRMVSLESLYGSVRWRHNRDEYQRWFWVVSDYTLSKVHLGDCSYYQYKKMFKRQFKRDKCTSDVFPSQVLLVLAMLGYITELGGWYVYNEGSANNHGYYYKVDKEKLMRWNNPIYPDYDSATTITNPIMPEWEMSSTATISFNEDGNDYDRLSWTKHQDWLSERQFDSICSVEVVKEGLAESSQWMFNFEEYKSYYNMTQQEQEDILKDWYSYQKLRDLSCGIVGACKDDSDKYAGRFYTVMTNMRSNHRHRFLRLDGELISEVDVSSAQPSFLGIMLNQETGYMSEWLRQCLKGTFYEWITEKTQNSEDRATIKRWMMQYLYSCYQPKKSRDYNKPHHPTFENRKTDDPFLCFQQRLNKFLRKNEPAIYNKIDYYKRNPEYRADKELYDYYQEDDSENIKKKKIGQGKWCSRLSYDLVKMEVQYIKNCIYALPENEKFWTIHDCIAVKESRSKEVKSIMEKVSGEMFGKDVILGIKIENTTENPTRESA